MRCADVNERYCSLSVHEKILRGDKEKAKYCYLTFSMIISFFSDNFSLKRLTAARAMLHWTRTKGKNRGGLHPICKYNVKIYEYTKKSLGKILFGRMKQDFFVVSIERRIIIIATILGSERRR